MINLEKELGERLYRIADAATVRPDLEGVKSGRATGANRNSRGAKTTTSRLAFLAAAAVIAIGGWAIVSSVRDRSIDVASEAASDHGVGDLPPNSSVPVDDEVAVGALERALPTIYLESSQIRPVTLALNRFPGSDISETLWELKSSYEIEGSESDQDEDSGSGVNVVAIPTAVTSVEEQLAVTDAGPEPTSVSLLGREGRLVKNAVGESTAIVETANHVVVLAFWVNTSDETIEVVLASAFDDLVGFQRTASNDGLDDWVLAAMDEPGSELEALFPRSDGVEPQQEPSPDQAGVDQLLQESDLIDGGFAYSFRELRLNPRETGDIEADAECPVLGELIAAVSAQEYYSHEFTGSDGWEFSHGILEFDPETATQVMDSFGRVGAECTGWTDRSTSTSAAFGQGDFFLAAYQQDDLLYYIELENGNDRTGPLRLEQLLAATQTR